MVPSAVIDSDPIRFVYCALLSRESDFELRSVPLAEIGKSKGGPCSARQSSRQERHGCADYRKSPPSRSGCHRDGM
jgi:hypothetical protein